MTEQKQQERRGNYPRPEKELYKLKDVQKFIEQERRHDELDRLRDIHIQKITWRNTVLFCGLLNLTFVILGIIGIMVK